MKAWQATTITIASILSAICLIADMLMFTQLQPSIGVLIMETRATGASLKALLVEATR